LDYCIEAKVYGIICFDIGLTLREGNREYFYENLDIYFPGIKQKYQNKYGNNYIITSDRNRELMEIFYKTCKQNTIVSNRDALFEYLHTFEDKSQTEQPDLFDTLTHEPFD
jgi:hypothetical protein